MPGVGVEPTRPLGAGDCGAYNDAQGRWMSPGDSGSDLLNPQTFNGYDYANNNPTNVVDPTGGGPSPTSSGQPLPALPEPVPGGGMPSVDTAVLKGCLKELFGVDLTEFNPARPRQSGSFAGYGPDRHFNYGNDADIYIIGDSATFSVPQLTAQWVAFPLPLPPGTLVSGLMWPGHPYRDYIGNNLSPMTTLKTQVHELGNSLQDITGAANNAPPVPGRDNDAGQRLEDCVNKGRGFKSCRDRR